MATSTVTSANIKARSESRRAMPARVDTRHRELSSRCWPALVSSAVLPADVAALVNGCLNVMGQLGMLSRTPRPPLHVVWISKVVTVASDSGGIFYPLQARSMSRAYGANFSPTLFK